MSLWSRNRRWNLFTVQLSVHLTAHILSIVYISEQFTVGMTNEILPESPRTMFRSLCGLRTTEESSDRHAPGRRTGALGLVFPSCFGKNGCFCLALPWEGWPWCKQIFFSSFLFFLAGFGIVFTRTMVNVKVICKMGLRPVYWNLFLTMERYSTLRY